MNEFRFFNLLFLGNFCRGLRCVLRWAGRFRAVFWWNCWSFRWFTIFLSSICWFRLSCCTIFFSVTFASKCWTRRRGLWAILWRWRLRTITEFLWSVTGFFRSIACLFSIAWGLRTAWGFAFFFASWWRCFWFSSWLSSGFSRWLIMILRFTLYCKKTKYFRKLDASKKCFIQTFSLRCIGIGAFCTAAGFLRQKHQRLDTSNFNQKISHKIS